MTTSLARYISFLFNPIMLLLVCPFFLLMHLGGGVTYALTWTGYTFFFLLLMTLFLMEGVKRGYFVNMDVSKREQRPLLFRVSILLAAFYLGGLYIFHGPQILAVLTIGVIAGLAIVSIINIKLKASIHVATISALIFTTAIVFSGYYLLLLFLIPLVAWARLKIKRHTLPETIVGGMLGVLLSLGIYALTKTVH